MVTLVLVMNEKFPQIMVIGKILSRNICKKQFKNLQRSRFITEKQCVKHRPQWRNTADDQSYVQQWLHKQQDKWGYQVKLQLCSALSSQILQRERHLNSENIQKQTLQAQTFFGEVGEVKISQKVQEENSCADFVLTPFPNKQPIR